ncbi:hypothetical protein [Asticcacaulis endophyticus]|uniref:Receptor-recognising protein Gp38 domain-containing protein n=1 Tax=Asticcacaulis endophyticus TaxID=1395890 RepID=A0A918UNM1_9CAUL|nr:hypothetical protein [Asticcacaulis endophyticus]GGZ22858.1 hypothetical protein GCM10011273_04660 [Asticcacaulis endophyticus]
MTLKWCALVVALWMAAGAAPAQDKPDNPENVTTVTVTANLPPDRISKPLTTILVTEPANLRALADASGYDGKSAANFLFVVEKQTTIMGKPGGGTAIDTGDWPDTVYLALAINGKVYGGGGNGGDGGPSAKSGTKGGDAIYVRASILIVIAETGTVEGGGGGGGGAEANNSLNAPGGGGGGGGFPNGLYGLGGGSADNGRSGTLHSPGRGGNNYSVTNWYWSGGIIPPPASGRASSMLTPIPGGNGGNAGRDGEPGTGDRGRGGGAGGYAVRANNIPVELILSGRIRGEIG